MYMRDCSVRDDADRGMRGRERERTSLHYQRYREMTPTRSIPVMSVGIDVNIEDADVHPPQPTTY